jgi:DNA-binding winged helix-turn-helix (wHTH) protein
MALFKNLKVSSFGSGSGSKQMASSEIRFGRFRLDLCRRTLLRDDQPVRLGGRPLDILCALASAGGDVLTEDEVMARLWSGYVVVLIARGEDIGTLGA